MFGKWLFSTTCHQSLINKIFRILLFVVFFMPLNANADAPTPILQERFDEGFFDLKWNSPKNALGNNYIFVNKSIDSKNKLLEIYVKKNDVKYLDGISIERIAYAFYDNEFTTVLIIYKEDNWNKVNSIMTNKYGKPRKSTRNSAFWLIDKIGIKLDNKQEGKMRLTITCFSQKELENTSNGNLPM